MRAHRTLTAVVLTATTTLGVLASCARHAGHSTTTPSDPIDGTATPSRDIEIEMSDYRYAPAAISVAKGETVRFRFTNKGKILHEAFFGTSVEQQEHATMMKAMAGSGDAMHMDHGAEALPVNAGASGELVQTFDTAGTFEIGCHQPGHWEAGMRATISVS